MFIKRSNYFFLYSELEIRYTSRVPFVLFQIIPLPIESSRMIFMVFALDWLWWLEPQDANDRIANSVIQLYLVYVTANWIAFEGSSAERLSGRENFTRPIQLREVSEKVLVILLIELCWLWPWLHMYSELRVIYKGFSKYSIIMNRAGTIWS